MNNKGAIELSVNFIVMFVLAVAILGVGVWLFAKIFTIAEQETERIDSQTLQELDRQLRDANANVAIGISYKKVNPGEGAVFAIGVKNRLGEEKEFFLTVDCIGGFDNEGNKIPGSGNQGEDDICDNWTFGEFDIGKILANEQKNVPIAFNVPKSTDKLLYTFNVQVYHTSINENNAYGPAQKIHIEVN